MPHLDPTGLHTAAVQRWNDTNPTARTGDALISAEAELIAGHAVTEPRPRKWVLALYRYELLWRSTGRTPRENTRARGTLTAEERRLADWARYQRRTEQDLTTYQLIRLDASPAFRWDPRGEHWQSRLNACITFHGVEGRLPMLSSSSPDEFALARWMGRQMRRRQQHELSPEQAAALDALMQVGVWVREGW